MAQTPGKSLTGGYDIKYTPETTPVASGDVVVTGSLAGLATEPIAVGALGTLRVSGIVKLPKVTGGISQGAACYWDADGSPVEGTAESGAVTTTSTGNTFIGYAAATAASGDSHVEVLALPAIVGFANGLQNVIADPGNGGAIPVTQSGSAALTSGGSGQTRTLAAPTFAGQQLAISFSVDGGGNIVLTAATGLNQAGNTTITFAEAGDSVLLTAIRIGANLRWRITHNDDCTLGGP